MKSKSYQNSLILRYSVIVIVPIKYMQQIMHLYFSSSATGSWIEKQIIQSLQSSIYHKLTQKHMEQNEILKEIKKKFTVR